MTNAADLALLRRNMLPPDKVHFFEILGRQTHEEALVLGDEVILGQTTLKKTALHVDCREHRLFPNPAHPDQPVQKEK
jgi:hypothetical protein